MSPSVDLSVSTRMRRFFLVGVLTLFGAPALGFGAVFVVDLLGIADGGVAFVVVFGLGAAVAVATGIGLSLRIRSGIPSDRYPGRFSEGGGITRIEQDRAIDRLREEEDR